MDKPDFNVIQADCVSAMAEMQEASVDAIVTDPPYNLGFMSKAWDRVDGESVDPAFLHWFAGFVDGEGCFSVHRKVVNGCEVFDCQFSIALRADDRPILERIQRTLGMGTLSKRSAHRRGGRDGNPQARYSISRKADCLRLREIFRGFPLRAKKAGDFERWSDALEAWVEHQPGEWDEMAQARALLMEGRAYQEEGIRVDPFQMWCWRWGREALRVLKPGGHALVMGGTRTSHRMTAGLEDAGFEIRDVLDWIYATGFPKSHNLNGDWNGWGTALKPAHEPIVMARKPLSGTVAQNVLEHGTGALNVDGCRVAALTEAEVSRSGRSTNGSVYGDYESVDWKRDGKEHPGRWPANLILSHHEDCVPVGVRRVKGHTGYPNGPKGNQFSVGDTPDGSRQEPWQGHADPDGLETIEAWECVEGCPVRELDGQSGEGKSGTAIQRHGGGQAIFGGIGGGQNGVGERPDAGYADSGGASRFFFVSDAKTIMDGCDANTAVESSSPANRAAGSAPSGVPTGAAHADSLPTDSPIPSPVPTTSATPSASDESAASDTPPTPNIAPKSSLGSERPKPSPTNSPANPVGPTEPTDTTTTTPSPSKSDGSVGAVMSEGTLSNAAPGVADSEPRFRYVAKASRSERNAGLEGFEEKDMGEVFNGGLAGASIPLKGSPPPRYRNVHPTVKPIALMRWLVRLVTPPSGTVLDPFVGSGTTGIAAALEGFSFIGIERDPEYVALARARIDFWSRHGEEALRIVADQERAEVRRQEIEDTGQMGLL